MKPIISVEGLGKSYTIRHQGQTRYKSLREEIFQLPKKWLSKRNESTEEFWALKDVTFDIMPGDRVGIIGRNGAGKSTLLKLLSRITEPTTGRITMRGRVASLLEVGTGFHPELTGRENIYLNGAVLGMARAEVRRKFDEIVDFAGVEKFLDTPVKRYSSGMYVRLAFAVAAHLEPEILIVDEVLAVGDAEFQKKCLGKMEEVSKGQGRTVLFVSHNMVTIRELCEKGMVLGEGKLFFNSNKIHECCHNYLAGSAVNSGRWNNSGREFQHSLIIPMSITLNNDIEILSEGIVNFGETVRLTIKIVVTNEVQNLDLFYKIFNEDSVVVYDGNIRELPDSVNLTKGNWQISTTLPTKIMNTGKYRLKLFATIYSYKWIFGEDSSPELLFEIIGDKSRYTMLNKQCVLAQPNVDWLVEKEYKNEVSTRNA